MTTIGQAFDRGRNNFDAIRLFSAVLVIYGHSYVFTGQAGKEPLQLISSGSIDVSGLGVCIFFVISGFLVTRSVLQHELSVYLTSRALRILPALLLVCAFDVFVIGPLFTRLPLVEYFGSTQTFYHFRNALIFDLHFGLPGTFTDLIIPAVNGSLWTLPIEVTMYLLLPFLALLGVAVCRRGIFVLYAAAAIGFLSLTIYAGPGGGGLLFRGVPTWHAAVFGLFFLGGSMLWVCRDRIPLNGGLAAVCLILEFAAFGMPIDRYVQFLSVPYLTIYAGLARLIPFPSKNIGDLSYGTYVFAFPVQQAIVSLAVSIGPLLLTVVSLPIILTLAFLSWRFVEQPALRLRAWVQGNEGRFSGSHSMRKTAHNGGDPERDDGGYGLTSAIDGLPLSRL